MLWIRLGVRELIKNRGFSLFFILNLSIGLAGFIAIHSFGRSLNRHLEDNLKEILTADLVLSANTDLTPGELHLADQVLGPDTTRARLISFYTMVKAGENARLIKVMAIDDPYPLYGEFALEGRGGKQEIQEWPGVLLTRDTAHALGVDKGDDVGTDAKMPLVLGRKTFYVHDFFQEDPDRSLTALELAPKIYMGIKQLEGTGLMGFGSRIRYYYYYRLGPGVDVPALTGTLRRAFDEKHQGQPRINVYDTRDVNQRLGRVTRYFTGYMGLVSVVALFLAGIATAYLFRGYLNLKQREMAVLMSIGATQWETALYMGCQLILLGSLAAVLAVMISLFLVPVFPFIFKGLIPDHLSLHLDPATIGLAVGMGMAGSLVFCLPVFVRIFGVKPLILLRGSREGGQRTLGRVLGQVMSFLPGVLAFSLVSVFVAGSVKNGMVFVAGFALALAFLGGMGWLIFSGCAYLSVTRNLVMKIAFRNLFRNKWSSLSCFVTIAMGAFLISIIPQIQKGLQTEIMRPEGLKIPVFFLVDIQEEQKNPFIEFMARKDADLINLSPMVRGRILTVNQKPFDGENLSQGSGRPRSGQRGRGRGKRLEFNFSYRKSLDDSETIVQGRALSETPWDFEAFVPFEISVEASFAERYGLSLGDIMGFDVQGIPMEGRVVNLRKVRWNSFQPNFFLLFQDGVLNDAPKTYLAAISQVAQEARQDLKNAIVNAFPNISVIDVTRMAGTLLTITDRLSLSIRFMAWLAIAAGLVSIFSIARHGAWKNANQVNLLKVLGADFNVIQGITLLEFGFIGFTAALFAVLLSLVFSRAVSWYLFDSLWEFDLLGSLVILLLTTGICMATAFMASRKVMNTKPVTLFSNTFDPGEI
ncbi:MAG: ABC transporter permease [Desulfobacterium sp.]|nr:ABC transporter permease [Desulfobacterium sp.]